MKTLTSNVSDYLESLPMERCADLGRLQDMIKGIWPGIVEDMAHGMPTYHLNGHALCSFADQKHFMAIYLMHYDLLQAFKNDLKVYDCGKSCIRFKRLDPEMLHLLDRVLKYTGSQMSTSIYFGKKSNLRGSNGRHK